MGTGMVSHSRTARRYSRIRREKSLEGKTCVECGGTENLRKAHKKQIYRCASCREKIYSAQHRWVHKKAEIAFHSYVDSLDINTDQLICACGSREKILAVKIDGVMLLRCEGCRARAYDHTKKPWLGCKLSLVWRGRLPDASV